MLIMQSGIEKVIWYQYSSRFLVDQFTQPSPGCIHPLSKLKRNEAPGTNVIFTEPLQHGSESLGNHLSLVEKVLSEWHESIMMSV